MPRSVSHGISYLFTGNIPIEGRTVDGRERETEIVTRTEDKKIKDWSKEGSSAASGRPHVEMLALCLG
ncbi:hypothetical protein KUCAC02_007186 [Chaenocephalus aceratus]|uniref:Uncharacterized protein n=1 Tax=Chaenocephalus aceratus TaxID=36190 RepID=A0ACB9X4P9_CHAAC|nr:hypothetical protein KUCAC02_007186 [Chaenocephalus aceratus]